jgi:hypothetical protein
VRPPFWADPKKKEMWRDEVALPLVMPGALGAYPGGEELALRVLARLVRLREHYAAVEAKKQDKKFQGAQRCVRTKHTVRASSWEEFGARVPRFAAAGDRATLHAAYERYRRFVADYRLCLTRWRAGDRNVVWPHGTWQMRVLHNVPCHPPPPS